MLVGPYYEIVKQVYKDNPELAHGFPITHFAHAFFKALSEHPNYGVLDSPDTSKRLDRI